MEDKIKEIKIGMYSTDEILEFMTNGEGRGFMGRSMYDAILDYITNLQESDKEWSMIFDTFSKRPYAHKYLEEKKKELGNKNIIGLDSEMIYKDYYELKSRIDKVIEYIKKHKEPLHHSFDEPDCDYWIATNPDDLLEILRGEE